MTRRWHITGSAPPCPSSARTAWCDGAADDRWRDGTDIELSHWIPNRTPAGLRADTSTAICLRAVAAGADTGVDLVINNHADTDGVLSVWVLLEPEQALRHRPVLEGAAAIGDFAAWAPPAAQALYEGTALALRDAERAGADPGETYARVFDVIPGLLEPDADRLPHLAAGLAALRASDDLHDSGAVRTERITPSLVHFVVPQGLLGPSLPTTLAEPPFNAPLAAYAPLLPHSRARRHFEDTHLVSIRGARGWFHDVWAPGYAWADTETLRRPAYLRVNADHEHDVDFGAPGDAALAWLNERDRGHGRWVTAARLTVTSATPGRGAPIVLSFVDDRGAAESSLDPDEVAALLAPAMA